MKKSLFALVAAAGAIATASAFAGDHKKMTEAEKEAKMAEHFAEVDSNGDGMVSSEEFLAYKAAKAEEKWAKMAEYAGDDGMISMDEMKAMHKAKMEKKKEMKKDM